MSAQCIPLGRPPVRVGLALPVRGPPDNLQAVADDGEAGTVQRSGDGCELGDHVLALAPFLHHAEYAGQLSLGALDAVDDGRHLRGGELH